MTCREFEEVLHEFADDHLPDAALRKRCIIHSSVCETCAAHLAAGRSLAAHLAEFAGATRNEHASLRVRAGLRAAVAERAAAQSKTARILSFASREPAAWPRWVLAATATILVFITIAGWLWPRATNSPGSTIQGRDVNTEEPKPASIETLSIPEPQRLDRKPASQVAKSNGMRRNRIYQSMASDLGLASEFVPLTLAADDRAIANGTLVRLEMSPEKLIAMGLPLQVEMGRKMVNAEVVMGDNGVAYAIRVVR